MTKHAEARWRRQPVCQVGNPPVTPGVYTGRRTAYPVRLIACTLMATVMLGLEACGATPAQAGGALTGHVSIGPLQPVERVGVPSPPPPPAACTARRLLVTPSGGGASQTVAVQPDCTYRVGLAPGAYVVTLARSGIDRATNLPATVHISAGQTTRLDVSVDTGMR